jgi:hypothetical protein
MSKRKKNSKKNRDNDGFDLDKEDEFLKNLAL